MNANIQKSVSDEDLTQLLTLVGRAATSDDQATKDELKQALPKVTEALQELEAHRKTDVG